MRGKRQEIRPKRLETARRLEKGADADSLVEIFLKQHGAFDFFFKTPKMTLKNESWFYH